MDDVAAAAKNPKAITDLLQDKYQFKLKGMGLISFHLGCGFVREDDGTMCMSPKRYIAKPGHLQVNIWFQVQAECPLST